MLPDLSYFHFLRPAWLVLAALWVVLVLVARRRQGQRDMFGGIIAPHLLEHLRLAPHQGRRFNPTSAGAVFILLVMVVLAGPSWRQQPSPLAEDDSALVLLLDLSSSMAQRDIQPSRLERAKQKAADLLALRPDKRTALVVYSGSAHTVLPLTADRDILTQYLAALQPAMMPRSGKFPEYALPRIDQVLADTNLPATILLLADGLGGASAAAFDEYFERQPHQLLVLGVGRETVAEGQVPLAARALRDLADRTDGRYFDLTLDDGDVRALNRRIDSHYVIVDDDALPWLDSGYPVVFACMALFLLWFRRGWTISWSFGWLLAVALTLPPAPAMAAGEDPSPSSANLLQWFTGLWLTPDQQGRLLLQRGHYRAAGIHFLDPMWKGIAHYYDEDFMVAAEYFSRVDSDDALFNEANARAQGRDYLRARSRYDELLARNPDYPGAAANRARVQQLIDDINRMSESQQDEGGSHSEELEPGGDDAVPAEGAESMSFEEAKIKQYSAEEILGSEATRDMWLRAVQQDPSDFLASKFNMQLQQEQAQ